jgi:hypothetical protein
MPAWRFIDPFPVLASRKDFAASDEGADAESLESIASNSTGGKDPAKDTESETDSDGEDDV